MLLLSRMGATKAWALLKLVSEGIGGMVGVNLISEQFGKLCLAIFFSTVLKTGEVSFLSLVSQHATKTILSSLRPKMTKS